MSEPRRVLDVSHLPTVDFDERGLVWWGTVGFMVIEGFTLALTLAAYFYLRTNEVDWPPGRTPNPDLLIPTINTLLIAAMVVPMRLADRAAREWDRARVARWLLVATAMSVAAVVLRWFELLALNARWDAHAYGSAAWGVMVLHGTLLLTDGFETGTLAVLFAKGPVERKRYPDASDAAAYQYFFSATQIAVYLIIYWSPRLL